MDSAREKRIGDLVRRLQKERIMRERFRLSLSEEEAYEHLLAANVVEVQSRHREFVYNNDVDDQIRQIARCLTADTSKFGIVLCGGCGNGKTTMLNAFQRLLNSQKNYNPNHNPNKEFYNHYGLTITTASYIVDSAKNDSKKFQELKECDLLGIDDLGTEPVEVMDYGNVMTPVIDLLTRRYEAQLFTIITTNLEPKEIRQRYGGRIADRLNEMMTKVIYRNSTYRTDNVQTANN